MPDTLPPHAPVVVIGGSAGMNRAHAPTAAG